MKNITPIASDSFVKFICAGALLLIAAKGQAQNLFVASGNNVIEITPGGVQSTFASLGAHAYGLAFDSEGNLFASVTRQTNSGLFNSIIKITPVGVQSTFATGSGNSAFGSLAFDSAGNLFVTGAYAGILEFTPQGVQSTFASGASGLGPAFDTIGNLFNNDGVNINKYTPGGMRSLFASYGNNPAGMAFNSTGDLFAASTDGHIYEYTPGGMKSIFVSGFDYPSGLAFNSAGDLFVTSPRTDTITEITPGGAESIFAPGLVNPGAIAFEGITLPVPEPSALGLLALGSVAFFLRRCCKRPEKVSPKSSPKSSPNER